MNKKQYQSPYACVHTYDGVDIVTASGTDEETGTKFASFNVGWLTTKMQDE